MASKIENNTNALQTVLEIINNLQSISSITPESIGAAAESHTQSANTITAGTFAGAVVAQNSSQTPSTSMLRNSTLVTTDTNPTNNGEIYWTYG